ncbi:uncharacterized protein UV8b_03279 [Ustilaginoidea virens]|uniref:Uncharacterized protein n=1 Tax=Ustilaginoidea virens TaxID=1159556 RepID=A0A063BTP1_USTVR|nr:uncharacterized protein UV8b_03279 [Ustilaginoidea virens]ARS01301.1 hypothetical protein [Ustilaginoidea virens]QUC19038.1 hypothetical protein UV8b_03279 [Ustilaginoidea virens]
MHCNQLNLIGVLMLLPAVLAIPRTPPINQWVQSCRHNEVTCFDCRDVVLSAQGIFQPGAGEMFIAGACQDLTACSCARSGTKTETCKDYDYLVEGGLCRHFDKQRAFCQSKGYPVFGSNFCPENEADGIITDIDTDSP